MAERNRIVDPRTKYVYTVAEGGLVEVFDPESGLTGWFAETGEWKSGELRYANRQMLGWMGRLSVRKAQRFADAQEDSDR
jgi:hypothetical protein